jgi:hypothetical protein
MEFPVVFSGDPEVFGDFGRVGREAPGFGTQFLPVGFEGFSEIG